MRWLRRLVFVALFGGGAAAGYRAWQARQPRPQVGAPEWPPLTDASAQPPTTFQPVVGAASNPVAATVPPDDHEAGEVTERATWLAPVDGECPAGYPIKANDSSHIFHVPGGRFYARTIPERCYADPADAERDGYRRAKA
jgi:hypothetical protein